MPERAATLLDDLLRKEGGYVDHPHDRGGPTNFGITESVADSAGWVGAMRDLPRDFAIAIYRRRYWTLPGLDGVSALAPKVAAELFDTGVNMGPAVAAGFLQRSLNALNRQGRDWPDIAVDRAIGPATLAAVRRYLAVRGDEAVLLKALNALQGARYVELAEGRQANEFFLFGWLSSRVA
ncbi:MAG: glycoside hydrolase family 108 protein [Polymorphobacter sp.]